jgi:hypothetical protein
MNKVLVEPVLVEFLKNGNWFGTHDEKYVAAYRPEGLEGLAATPERYYYFPWASNKIRISYYEQRI